MKKKILIIGTGLGGCHLASKLYDQFEVIMIENVNKSPSLRDLIKDTSQPAVTYPIAESGLGGTTKAWHNALMEIDSLMFDKRWPYSKEKLIPYYEQAYLALSGISRKKVLEFSDELKGRLLSMGFSDNLLTQNMFIPNKRINAWHSLKLNKKVKLIEGEVIEFVLDGKDSIRNVIVLCPNGNKILIEANYYVLSCGGLSTPILLQKLAKANSLKSLDNAGRNYEDHPMAFVGEVELCKPIYKCWNYPIKTPNGNANIRLPLSFYWKELHFSYQLRPAHHLRLAKPREKVVSIVSNLRNFPLQISNYWQLLTHFDDISEILSFKFGLKVPTNNYSILLVAEQPPSSDIAVWRDETSGYIFRKWEIKNDYIETINDSILNLLELLRPIIKKNVLFQEWNKNIFSSSHHSGTARISNQRSNGVCDINGQVFGMSNLFICDGSLIPGSGFVNTGLTIVALAFKMADYFLIEIKQ